MRFEAGFDTCACVSIIQFQLLTYEKFPDCNFLSSFYCSLLYNCDYIFFQGDLHSYVRVRKRLREPEAKRLFRQMCEVVKSCHEQGIVLRDLKLRKFVFADAER